MKRSAILYLLPLLLGGTLLHAQVTINWNDLPMNPGTEIWQANSGIMTPVPVNLGSAGPNQSWNFSAMTTTDSSQYEWVNPFNTPYSGEFPHVNRCAYHPSEEFYQYYNLNATALFWLGYADDPEIVQYNNSQPMMIFPMHYQTTWTGIYSYEIQPNITMYDSTVFMVDAWGTVTDALGTFDCLRIKGHWYMTVTYFGTSFTMTYWTYEWYVPGYGALVQIQSNMDETNPNFTEGYFIRITDIETSALPNVNVTLTPTSLPIIIPPAGGDFHFGATVVNNSTIAQTFDAWLMVQYPTGPWYVIPDFPLNLTLPGGATVSRLRTQYVPGNAPPGTFAYRGYVGQYPSVKWDSSGFYFVKTGVDEWASGDWENSGEDFDFPAVPVSDMPGVCALSACPNPFNPETMLNFSLPSAANATLTIQDLAGRVVATIHQGWLPAGEHSRAFNAASLPSGIYFARLQTGGNTSLQKLVLVK